MPRGISAFCFVKVLRGVILRKSLYITEWRLFGRILATGLRSRTRFNRCRYLTALQVVLSVITWERLTVRLPLSTPAFFTTVTAINHSDAFCCKHVVEAQSQPQQQRCYY